MRETIEKLLPGEIEARSFEIIARELGERTFPPEQEAVIKRVIHTTADFDYADNLVFSDGAVEAAHAALKRGASIVTDTNMARAGINKTALGKLGGQVFCFMADEDVAARAKALGETRAAVSVDKAAELSGELIFAVGNAPTASSGSMSGSGGSAEAQPGHRRARGLCQCDPGQGAYYGA